MRRFCQINRIVEELPVDWLQFIAFAEAAKPRSITVCPDASLTPLMLQLGSWSYALNGPRAISLSYETGRRATFGSLAFHTLRGSCTRNIQQYAIAACPLQRLRIGRSW